MSFGGVRFEWQRREPAVLQVLQNVIGLDMYHHHLVSAQLRDLRPTQVTVGYVEVEEKRREWTELNKKQRRELLESHVFPCVLGPKGRYYIVDHHHLGLALLQEGTQRTQLTVLENFEYLAPDIFWRVMEFRRWTHPYDASGRRVAYADLPKQLTELEDDPYRSLAGLVRRAGGFAKDTEPFSEFLWADFFRTQLSAKQVTDTRRKVLKIGLALAHSVEARYLPGWSGEAKSIPPQQHHQ